MKCIKIHKNGGWLHEGLLIITYIGGQSIKLRKARSGTGQYLFFLFTTIILC